MKVTTATYANEIEWSIGCDGPRGCPECKSDGNYEDEESYDQKCCLPVDDDKNDFVITCEDTYGDGWHGSYLEINGKKYCEQFVDGKIHREALTNNFPVIGKISSVQYNEEFHFLRHNIDFYIK